MKAQRAFVLGLNETAKRNYPVVFRSIPKRETASVISVRAGQGMPATGLAGRLFHDSVACRANMVRAGFLSRCDADQAAINAVSLQRYNIVSDQD